MSRSYKHNPGYSYPSRSLKFLARRRERHSSLDTIGYLSNPDGDPLVSKSKRAFARLYSSWDIHDKRILVPRERDERWLMEIMEDERDAVSWLGESWREVPFERYLYQYSARCCYWKWGGCLPRSSVADKPPLVPTQPRTVLVGDDRACDAHRGYP